MTSNPTLSELRLTAHSPLSPSVSAWEYYLQDQGRSTHTIKAFSGDLQLLVEFLPPDRTLGTVTTRDLSQFTDWLQHGRGVPCSPKSLSRRVTSVKSFFRWLVKYGVLTTDPAEKLLQQSVISPLPEVLTVAETARLLETVQKKRRSSKPDARPYTLLKLLLETAIKKGECLGILVNHIDLESPDGAIVFIRYTSPSNRYKERKLPLSDDWISSYLEYLDQYKPVEQVFNWSPRRLEYILEDLGKDAGLAKHVSFDMCRWTSVLNDYRSGMEQDKIRQKLGISKIQWREVSMKLRQLSEDKP